MTKAPAGFEFVEQNSELVKTGRCGCVECSECRDWICAWLEANHFATTQGAKQ